MAIKIGVKIGSGNGLLPDGISKVPCYSSQGNFTVNTKVTHLYDEFENNTFKITAI